MQKRIPLLLTLVFFSLSLHTVAGAQSSEEMRMLELFYEKKDLVITPTRYPKPIYQVAENITVITSIEIEAMNAHTVAEVLRRVPGIFVNSSQDFGAASLLSIQGSEDRHATVFLDGVRWNFLSGGNAETNTIPVGVIDRIEIIKGPASSAWGSSLGGVINIITKRTGRKETPHGNVQLSYGESGSLDAGVQAFGKESILGYYLYAGKQGSGGLRGNRDMESVSLFSKVTIELSKQADFNFSFGYSEPENDLGSFPSGDIRSDSDGKTLHANASLDLDLAPRSTFTATAYYLSQDININNDVLGLGLYGPAGSPFLNSDYKNETYGATARVVWEPARHTVVAGFEINQGGLEQTIRAGDFLQAYGVSPFSRTKPDVVSWAVYLNDTICLNRWAITPGLRFDHNTVSGSFFSPSLGVTYQPKSDILFRGTVSRGFHYPPLGISEGGGVFLDPNPELDAEEVWSYQAGFETTTLPLLRVKTTFFLHELDKFMLREFSAGGPPNYNDLFVNSGSLQRRGVEIDLKTEPVKGFSIEASGIYVHFDEANSVGATEAFAYNLIFAYESANAFIAQLAGHFEDLKSAEAYQSNFDDVLWDLNLRKSVALTENLRAILFLTAHNLLNGSQYNFGDTKNPNRWIEGGIRFAF